jgi:hypothetical protein
MDRWCDSGIHLTLDATGLLWYYVKYMNVSHFSCRAIQEVALGQGGLQGTYPAMHLKCTQST